MLLPVLTVAAMLLGSWIFAAIIFGVSAPENSEHPSIFSDRKVSLFSLILFFFFPEFYQPPSRSLPPREVN